MVLPQGCHSPLWKERSRGSERDSDFEEYPSARTNRALRRQGLKPKGANEYA